MEEVKMSTRVLLVSGIVLLVILLTGPLGYKFGIVPLQPSLISLLIAVVGGLLVVLVGLIYLVIALKNGLGRNRNLLLVAMLVGFIPALIIGPQMGKAREVPPIHDITTDPENPPVFVDLLPVRENAPNGAEYGGAEGWSPESLALATREAYPELAPIRTSLSIGDAVRQSESVLEAMGLEVVSADPIDGRVEATATTFWFGFKDDMVLRISESGDESVVDIRSMSRVGQSDVGANAARIMEFVQRFSAQ